MRKVSAILKSEAHFQFQQKRKEVIAHTIHKNYKDKPNFKEIMDMYLERCN